jgi:mannitol-1-/sugar-/sorbitol-6-/2-deoxyglucose-6-phosphatase
MFAAAIFDLDGLLIDSEPFWKDAEREIFGGVGVAIDPRMAEVTASMTTREVAAHWYRFRPWQGPTVDEVEAAVIARVGEHISAAGQALPGVAATLELCARLGLAVALASNSPARLCELALARLGIAHGFRAVVSADHVPRGKPDPAVYLHAARLLAVAPPHCLVFEDSATGVRAARAAGMTVIAVPSPGQRFAPEPHAPHLTLGALGEFHAGHARELWGARAAAATA